MQLATEAWEGSGEVMTYLARRVFVLSSVFTVIDINFLVVSQILLENTKQLDGDGVPQSL